MDWKLFRPVLKWWETKNANPVRIEDLLTVVLMFKILILQSLYNLSDEQTEFQIRDRLSFMRFWDLSLGDDVPDAKTIWFFREELTEAGVIEKTFDQFEAYPCEQGFSARRGQIVDAGIVPVPKQRNSRKENGRIKRGKVPEDWWREQKKRQKDTDGRWTKKNGQNYYGYKNHIDVDVKHKLIRN